MHWAAWDLCPLVIREHARLVSHCERPAGRIASQFGRNATSVQTHKTAGPGMVLILESAPLAVQEFVSKQLIGVI